MGARAFWVIAALVAMAIAGFIAATSGGSGNGGDNVLTPGGSSESDNSTVADDTGPAAVNEVGSSDGSGGTFGDLCDAKPAVHGYLVEIGLLKEDDLADSPLLIAHHPEGWWEVRPLGADGAFEVGESLTNGDWLCDLAVSPELVAWLAQIELEPDGSFPIDEVIAVIEGDTGSDAEPDGSGDSDTPLPVLTPDDLKQQSRDLINAAATAELLGDLGSKDQFMDAATDRFEAYGEIVLNDSSDMAEVMEVSAGAQILGLDDLINEAAAKIQELAEKELADADELFSPCTEDPNIIRIYKETVARTSMILGGQSGAWSAWIDIQQRRKNGEPIPECEGGLWVSSTPLEGWDGTVEIRLESCGFSHWEGKLTASGVLEVEGGSMTLEGEVPLEFHLLDKAAATTFQTPWSYGRPGTSAIDLEMVVYVMLEVDGGSGEGIAQMSASGFFEMTGEADWAELTIFFSPGTFDMTITANGMQITQSRAINWEEKNFTATIDPLDALCSPTG